MLDPEIPEGSVIQGQILVTSYFDDEGRMKYVVGTGGNFNLAQAVGLLELAKVSVYKMYLQNEPYEPDEPEDPER